jgi:hypothetical protein
VTEQASPGTSPQPEAAGSSSGVETGAEVSPAAGGTPAVTLHGSEDPETSGNVWSGPALSERPGDVTPAPKRYQNPLAVELHGSATPAEQGVWIPSDGGANGPYDLGRTEHVPPAGWVNPPAAELHGPTTPAL